MEPAKSPTAQGRVILDRMAELSLSMAEIERRCHLSKNTIANAVYGPRQPQAKTIEILAAALELPVERLTAARCETAAVEPSFGRWLTVGGGRLDLWIAAIGALATAFFLYRGLREPGGGAAVPAVHGLVLLALLTRLPRVVDPPAVEGGTLRMAWTAAGDLRRYWGIAWTFWVLLYVALAGSAAVGLMATDPATGDVGRWTGVGLNFLQNATTVMLLLAYEVVSRPTVREDLTRSQLLPVEAWVVFALLVSVAEGALVLTGVAWSAQQWFGWVSGFAQGTALALLVGRLDSKYIEPPTAVIALLYLYAAIQGAWPVFQQHPQLMLVLTFLALVLKCLLFLFVSWLFASRIVIFYLARVRQLDAEVTSSRSAFLKQLESDSR